MKTDAVPVPDWRRGSLSTPCVGDSTPHDPHVPAKDDESLAERLQWRFGIPRDEAVELVRQFGEHL